MILIRANIDDGRASRYECGGECVRKTHEYQHDRPVSAFDWAWLQEFRTNPPDWTKIEPPPRPTNSPAGAGIIGIAA